MNTDDLNNSLTNDGEAEDDINDGTEETDAPDVPDMVVDEDAELGPVEQIKKLRTKLKIAVAEKQQYLDAWQRDKAEFVNIRRRDEESKKDFSKFATEALLNDIIPVLDSFDLAMNNKEAWEKIDKNWRMGIEHIATQLRGVLKDNGLVEINPIGQTFDVTRDEAISHEPVSDASQDHIVTAVVQKGYTLNGKNLRPAKVKVGEFKAN